MSSDNPREILGVPAGASLEDIKRAYKKLAARMHPDVGGDPEQFRKLTEAYNKLRDSAEAADVPADAIFCEDATASLQLTLEEMAFGCRKQIFVKVGRVPCRACRGVGAAPKSPMMPCISCLGTGKVPSAWGLKSSDRNCSVCKGAGTTPAQKCRACSGKGVVDGDAAAAVNIPAGVEHGQEICFSGDLGGFRGQLFVVIVGLPHDRFDRIGDDLIVQHRIGVCEAIAGATGKTVCLDGKEIDFRIRPGTQPLEHIVIPGAGIRNAQTGRVGDLRIVAKVEIPQKMSPRAAKLVDELADEFTRK